MSAKECRSQRPRLEIAVNDSEETGETEGRQICAYVSTDERRTL